MARGDHATLVLKLLITSRRFQNKCTHGAIILSDLALPARHLICVLSFPCVHSAVLSWHFFRNVWFFSALAFVLKVHFSPNPLCWLPQMINAAQNIHRVASSSWFGLDYTSFSSQYRPPYKCFLIQGGWSSYVSSGLSDLMLPPQRHISSAPYLKQLLNKSKLIP